MGNTSELFESRLEEIVRVRRELDAQEAGWVALVGDYTRSGDWQADGFPNAASAVRTRCRMTPAAGRATVRLAKRLHRLPETAKAFGEGEISLPHATIIANACTDERAAEIEAGEEVLADAARAVNPDDLRDLVKRVTDALDGDGGAANDGTQYEQNRFHVSPLGDRVRRPRLRDRFGCL